MDIIKLAQRKHFSYSAIAGLALAAIGLPMTAHAAMHSYDMVVTRNAYTVDNQPSSQYDAVLPLGSQIRVDVDGEFCTPTMAYGSLSCSGDTSGHYTQAYLGDENVFGSSDDYTLTVGDDQSVLNYYIAGSWVLPAGIYTPGWMYLYFPTIVINGQKQVDFSHLLSVEYAAYDDGWSMSCDYCRPTYYYDLEAKPLSTPSVPVPPAALMFLSGLASLFTRRFWRSIAR